MLVNLITIITMAMPELCKVAISVPLEKLIPFGSNVRKDTDSSHIDTLAADIAESGLLHPITVRPNEDGELEVIAGWRRVLAHKLLGRETIPANVLDKDVDEQKAFEISLAENMHRHPLKYVDKCAAIRRCYDDSEGNMRETVKKTRLAPSTIRKYVEISNLPQDSIARLDSDGDDHLTLKEALAMAKSMQNTAPELPMDDASLAAMAENGNEAEEAEERPPKKRKVSVKKEPWIYDVEKNPIAIPEALYGSVYEMVRNHST